MKLWNYKSSDLPRKAYPRAHDVASQAINSDDMCEGRWPEHLLITQGLYSTCNSIPQYILGYFVEMYNRLYRILHRIYRLTVCNCLAFALSRRRVSRTRPRVFRETITVISLWRHNSGHGTMQSLWQPIATAYPEQWAVSPYKEERAYGHYIRKQGNTDTI